MCSCNGNRKTNNNPKLNQHLIQVIAKKGPTYMLKDLKQFLYKFMQQ